MQASKHTGTHTEIYANITRCITFYFFFLSYFIKINSPLHSLSLSFFSALPLFLSPFLLYPSSLSLSAYTPFFALSQFLSLSSTLINPSLFLSWTQVANCVSGSMQMLISHFLSRLTCFRSTWMCDSNSAQSRYWMRPRPKTYTDVCYKQEKQICQLCLEMNVVLNYIYCFKYVGKCFI